MVRREKPKPMPDPLTTEQRSWLMSRIRSEDTKPEWVLRCALHRLGFRFRLRDKRLPGRPDLVFLESYQSGVSASKTRAGGAARFREIRIPRPRREFESLCFP